ncbi:MAG: MBL fold metallo-hydrolase [Sphingobacteriia bacterium 24-36-13]|jgi:glyoxylase-like metal-dependent hydrolase (beta-lactamase superfamily II)/rhodanese-related sulfurtransferase|uniref:MBL fold metallo-hydrolase n=1 Tax=Sediminibacterium sp. TaxID=1917865 RepID=UPI000BC5C5D8|nr:MBL fold metallo-hydrolase [Sediminibacterium sp.]OYY09388.1 MAG: MBL fold metallo-hydrolase [Sphingobacteriia bacterium 35-36-14]OYZ52363.1 MAG: MBL fold metallo-hydrolase [Sphingobacteriia bacterium 24-36-13]OZA64080.1 MAG: MBL fold metallo-hydrolase [Sphingobacteriia bacterium 39-36-14]HQS24465.1 MBL fold metallo-hydrolase [Sediminibacterium sp.]HQS35742.1 MBL fold metallo-hydrolase [Sediminibacterium sp.]
MFIKQLYTGCISEAAYYIESNGKAAIIDPIRDIDAYLALAKERNAQIQYIFETHFHADFVSGHLDLAAATGATIVYGPSTVTKYPVHVAKDLEIFKLGNISIQVLHTPGHTLESSCYLLKDEEGNNKAIFTGDTLFVGDVGRPDLAQKGNDITMNDLAGMLYDSLQEKIIPLADEVVVYPAHGAGSSCGKNLGADSYSTIGVQKASNYALQAESKEAFIKAVTDGLNAPPAYFPINASINKDGYTSLDSILAKSLHPLSIPDFKEKIADNAILLDTRHPDQFMLGFVPGSINIGLNGRFAEWAGTLLPFTQPIILITEIGAEKESIVRLSRVGIDKVVGYLSGGFEAWQTAGESIDMIIDVEADELAMDLPFDENLVIIDVRRETEYANEHVKEAINIPLDQLTDPGSMANLDDHHNIYIHCASGYRSVIAASMIKRQGIHNIRNVIGGIEAIKGLPEKFEFEKETAALN